MLPSFPDTHRTHCHSADSMMGEIPTFCVTSCYKLVSTTHTEETYSSALLPTTHTQWEAGRRKSLNRYSGGPGLPLVVMGLMWTGRQWLKNAHITANDKSLFSWWCCGGRCMLFHYPASCGRRPRPGWEGLLTLPARLWTLLHHRLKTSKHILSLL